MDNPTNDYEKEYSERFGWRKEEYIDNIKELAKITQSYGLDPLKSFPCLFISYSKNQLDSMRFSILMLSYEATICYIYGIFQSCILTCGALVERILKLEYLDKNHQMPENGEWTLGRCIYKLDWTGTRITNEILDLAKKIKEPRDDRAHALLEHSDPRLSMMGGRNRGISFLSNEKFLIEPFRGDASLLIEITFKILAKLYSTTGK